MKKSMRVVLLAALLIMLIPGTSALAAPKVTQRQVALQAYQKVLDKGYYQYREFGIKWTVQLKEFTLLDINQDGVPEMITQRGRFGRRDVWALKGKKAKRIHSFTPFQGNMIYYSRTNKAVCYDLSSTASLNSDGFFRMKSRSSVQSFEFGARWNNVKRKMLSFWCVNGKRVSEKNFRKKAKMRSTSDAKCIIFYANTSTNRCQMGKLRAY